ncbi:MAG TPA: hypothetical protein VNA25_08675, partial [Phycisphaerae bacterium]|nr:hypothetical protein [Phycisphaerae bacterium]
NAPIGTRFYKVYGAKFVHDYIRTVCLPRAMLGNTGGAFREHLKFFKSLDASQRLVPDVYSVVAIGHRTCGGRKLRCLDLTDDLCDLSGLVTDDVYGNTALNREDNPIYWYVTKVPSCSFYLQLLGPLVPVAELTH